VFSDRRRDRDKGRREEEARILVYSLVILAGAYFFLKFPDIAFLVAAPVSAGYYRVLSEFEDIR